MGALRFLRGELRVDITGAAPEDCLNRFSCGGVEFWAIERVDALHYRVSILKRAQKTAQALAARAFCTLTVCAERGLFCRLRQALRRPVLLFGLPLAVFLAFFLQSFVWTVEIDGCEALHPNTVRYALEELGIAVGARADRIEYKQVRDSLLRLVPELSWAAVNRSGGKLYVSVAERRDTDSNEPPYAAAHLVAARDGVITQTEVAEGMTLCRVGQTVRAGELLVSGVEDYGLYLRAVCAQGEIYGQTWHTQTLVTPANSNVKRYTGQQWTRTTLRFGRKRINLCGNSGNSGTTCDKIGKVRQVRLFGVAFPIYAETEIFREYETYSVEKTEETAKNDLSAAFLRMTEESMIGGRIEQTAYRMRCGGGLYILNGTCTCNEMLARLCPFDPISDGGTP